MTTSDTPATAPPLAESPILVGGEWEDAENTFTARAAGSGSELGTTFEATTDQLDRAAARAVDAFETTRRLSSYERGELLRRIAELVDEDSETLARSLALEIGKPIRDARTEVQRTALTFRTAAEEAERLGGEMMPLDVLPTSRGRWGITRRMPLGPVAGITPFNVPVSLSAHKLAPALAVGNTIVLKPDSRVALTLLRLAELMERAGTPHGALSMLPMDRSVGDGLVTDDRFGLLSFTGSAAVGWDMRSRAGRKKVTLELGGNAPVIVDETADITRAVDRIVAGGFKFAGQLCISTQRVFVHWRVRDELLAGLIDKAEGLRVGEPLDEKSDLGPMINDDAARRTLAWIDEAVDAGGQVLTGGTGQGAYVNPTVMEQVPRTARLRAEEAFAPVLVVNSFDDITEAFDAANDSPFGLQAGVFTNDVRHSMSAFERLDVGTVVLNDVPTFRVDNMPFGGSKDSGLGREGVRWAMEDMSELRLLVLMSDEESGEKS